MLHYAFLSTYHFKIHSQNMTIHYRRPGDLVNIVALFQVTDVRWLNILQSQQGSAFQLEPWFPRVHQGKSHSTVLLASPAWILLTAFVLIPPQLGTTFKRSHCILLLDHVSTLLHSISYTQVSDHNKNILDCAQLLHRDLATNGNHLQADITLLTGIPR